MPELPEVEALAAALAPRAEGLVVARFDVAAINALKTFAPPATATLGSAVLGFSRRGKHLIIDLADPDGEPLAVVIHLGRAGWVRWRDDPPPARRTPPRAAGLAVRISLARDAGAGGSGAGGSGAGGSGAGGSGAGGSGAGTADGRAPVAAIDVTEAGTQKRLAVHIVRDPQDVPRVASLGPEPLSEEFDLPTLEAILDAAGRSQIKGVLRDQARIAGIGNAYSDEILHRSRLSPFAPAAALGPQERSTLLASMKDLLSQAVTAAVASDPASLKAEKKASMAVHGRTGLPCPVCGDTIREVSFADSSLQYCPTCQTGGRILADRRMSRLLK